MKTDLECQEAAEAARQQGRNMIRSHLQDHLVRNPQSTFVTWIATLHPENATVSIDPRFFIPGNPWLTVYEDMKAEMFTTPVAHVVDVEPSPVVQQTGATTDTATSSVNNKAVDVCSGFSVLDKIVGFCFILTTVTTTFTLEITSLIVYSFAVVFAQLVNWLGHPNVLTALPLGVFMFTWQLLALVDLILLYVGVFVVELLGLTCWFICCLFGGCRKGRAWHQANRRLSHLMRWAFRTTLERCSPSRSNPFILPRLTREGTSLATESISPEPGTTTNDDSSTIQTAALHVPGEPEIVVVGPEDIISEEATTASSKV